MLNRVERVWGVGSWVVCCCVASGCWVGPNLEADCELCLVFRDQQSTDEISIRYFEKIKISPQSL